MREYHKRIELGGEEHWFVDMGRRDHINGPASYGFPTLEAAQRFALAHAERDSHRSVGIRHPDGSFTQVQEQRG